MPSVRGPRQEASRPADAAKEAEPAEPANEPGAAAKIVSLLGSLQLALLLLGGTSALLITGTFLESWYGAAVASQLIYQSWWFGYLLAILAVNITCAALKKWPWKKHQTGFLITHVGLLTLLAGGAISAGFGSSGMMLLVDSADLASPTFGAVADDHLNDRRHDTLRVRRPDQSAEDFLEADFGPGWIPWKEDGLDSSMMNPLARTLAWISQPSSPARRWSMDDLEIELVEYAPQADWEPIRPAAASSSQSARFPAARFRIESPMAGKLPPQWIADHDAWRTVQLGPGLVLWLAAGCNEKQMHEFGREPSAQQREKEGELVIGWGDREWRWNVSKLRKGGAVELADGWRLVRVKFQADTRDPANPQPIDPALSLELRSPNGVTYGLVTSARRAGGLFALPGYPPPDRLPAGFWVWYHAPDPAFANPSLRGLMRLAMTSSGQLWMRSLHRGPAPADLWITEPRVELKENQKSIDIWPAMQGKLFVQRFLPEAESLPDCHPRARVGESEDPAAPPAVRCRLSRGAIRQEVWLPRRPGVEVVVPLGNESIELAYTQRREPLGFSVELKQAILKTEAASGMPALRLSKLEIRDRDSAPIQGQTTLNEPLEHRGYKLYQGAIQNIDGDRPNTRHRSVLLVGYDPGVWFKYCGSLLVCLGIACMFWMKAYFFGSWWGDDASGDGDSSATTESV